MPNRYQEKPGVVKAIQFNGENYAEIQAIVGVHYLDNNNQYEVPNFDKTENWWPAVDPARPAVLWIADNAAWVSVGIEDWVVKDDGELRVLTNKVFNKRYEAIGD